jgi:hypothetical protein
MAHALEVRDTAVVEIACRVVGALALHAPETQRALRESGACRMVCECLRRYVTRRVYQCTPPPFLIEPHSLTPKLTHDPGASGGGGRRWRP